MSCNDPNPRCCYKPDVVVKVRETRVSVETVKKEKIAVCPNCDELKKIMDTEYTRYGN